MDIDPSHPSHQVAAAGHGDTPAAFTTATPVYMPQEQWERHKDILWGLWLRDRRTIDEVKTEMERLGFYASSVVHVPLLLPALTSRIRIGQFNRQFTKRWGFHRKLTAAFWTYVGHQTRQRKPEPSDVIVEGVHLDPKMVLKRTHDALSRQLKPVDPEYPHDLMLSICSLSAFTLKMESLKLSWSATMPWLQFSQRLVDSGFKVLTHAPRKASAAESTLQLVNRALPTRRDLSNPSLPSAYLVATMPQVYKGEHIRNSQLICISQSDEATGLLLKLLLYRISNNSVHMEDKEIMGLVEHSGLMAENIDPSDAFLTNTTTQALLEKFFGAALRELHRDIISWLLNLGVSPNTRHLTDSVSEKKHLPLLVILEQRWTLIPTSGGDSLIPIAAAHQFEILELLVSSGAAIHQYCCKDHGTALRYAVSQGNANAVLLFTTPGRPNPASLSQKDYADLLYNMAWDEQAFQRISERYANAHHSDNMLDLLTRTNGLFCASSIGSTGLLGRLIGANFNKINFNRHNRRGVSPLLSAIHESLRHHRGDSRERIQTLLHLGAEVNYQPGPLRANGDIVSVPFPTPLHIAASKSSVDICQVLLDHGANINALAAFPPNFQQPMSTALQSAIGYGKNDCAQCLLDRGALIQGDELLILLRQGAFMQGDEFMRAVATNSDSNMLPLMSSLIDRGVDLQRESTTGETALQTTCRLLRSTDHLWLRKSYLKATRSLVDAGASHSNEMATAVGSVLLEDSAVDFRQSCNKGALERLQWVVDNYNYRGAYSSHALVDLLCAISHFPNDRYTRSQVLTLARRLVNRRTRELVQLDQEASAAAEGVNVYLKLPDPALMEVIKALSQPPSDENYVRLP